MRLLLVTTCAFTTLTFSTASLAGPGEDLIESNKCGKCHTATTTKKAPSFASIAAKVKGDAGKATALAEMFKKGSDDHNAIKASDADIKAMIAVVLAAK